MNWSRSLLALEFANVEFNEDARIATNKTMRIAILIILRHKMPNDQVHRAGATALDEQ